MNKEKATEKVTVRKSNKSVKSAVMLFGAVLITTSLLGGVLAKYTSDIGTASDTGRVAVWGLTAREQKLNLFDVAYNKGATDPLNTVESKNTQKVIAPGTKIKGTVIVGPDYEAMKDELAAVETALEIHYTASNQYPNNDPMFGRYVGDWQVETSKDDPTTFGWWPLRFKVYQHDGTSVTDETAYNVPVYEGLDPDGNQHLDGLNKAIAQRLIPATGGGSSSTEERTSGVIYPNDSPEVKKEKIAKMGVKIEWEWEFSSASNSNQDFWDTQLGNKLMGSMDEADTETPRFELNMSYNAVQVD